MSLSSLYRGMGVLGLLLAVAYANILIYGSPLYLFTPFGTFANEHPIEMRYIMVITVLLSVLYIVAMLTMKQALRRQYLRSLFIPGY